MIAVLDSGVGGVSVLRELVRLMPGEDFLYYGDTANAPYGTKSPRALRRIVRQKAELLRRRGAKALVIACNTATAVAAADLRRAYPDWPVIGIEPALKPAALLAEHPRVLVMATPLTLTMPKYRTLEERFAATADITDLPCPGLMELVEAGHLDDGETERYLRELLASVGGDFDACVLGCTHYPHVKAAIARHLDPRCVIIDGGAGTARQTKRRLAEAGLLPSPTGYTAPRGRIVFENSRGSAETDALAARLLLG